jgi:hypothetical protein
MLNSRIDQTKAIVEMGLNLAPDSRSRSTPVR